MAPRPIKDVTTGISWLKIKFSRCFWTSSPMQPAPRSTIGRFDLENKSTISVKSNFSSIGFTSSLYPNNSSGLMSVRCTFIAISKRTGPFLPVVAIWMAFSNSYRRFFASSTKAAYLVIGLTMLIISVSWKPCWRIGLSYLYS